MRTVARTAAAIVAPSRSRWRLQRHRSRTLRHVLAAAQERDGYRARWAGIDVDAIDGPDRLSDLPVTERAHLRDDAERIRRSAHVAGLVRDHTSGSSGAPLEVWWDPAEVRLQGAVWTRTHHAYGLRPWHRTAYFRNTPISPGWSERLGIYPGIHMPIEVDDAELAMRLEQAAPHVLGGYPSHLAELVERLDPRWLRTLGVKIVTTGSEQLTTEVRARLERVFGVPVRDLYGCVELGSLAGECHAGRRHIHEDAVVLEVVDGEGRPVAPGVAGEVLVTGLAQWAMPIVRYRIGDQAVLAAGGRCPCGRVTRVLEHLEGRSDASVATPRGRRLTGTVLGEELRKVAGIVRYQVEQRAADDILLRVVTVAQGPEVLEAARDALLAMLPDADIRVEVQRCDRLLRTPGGKTPTVLRRVVDPV